MAPRVTAYPRGPRIPEVQAGRRSRRSGRNAIPSPGSGGFLRVPDVDLLQQKALVQGQVHLVLPVHVQPDV